MPDFGCFEEFRLYRITRVNRIDYLLNSVIVDFPSVVLAQFNGEAMINFRQVFWELDLERSNNRYSEIGQVKVRTLESTVQ